MTFHSHARKPKLGTWLVSCDVCGIIHLNTQVKKRWDNLYVCENDWERDHPQKNIKLPRERIAAPFERVESVDGTGNSFIPLCTVFGGQAVAGAAVAGCSVAGTWRLVDQGGSLLAPPAPTNPICYEPSYVGALLHMNGSNGSGTFTDEIGNVWTGNVATITTAESKWGGASGDFTASGAYIRTPDAAFFDFGATAFTLECWVKIINGTPPGGGAQHIFDAWFGASRFLVRYNGGSVQLYTQPSGSVLLSFAVNPVDWAASWQFLAICRDGATWTIWVNGLRVATTTNLITLGSTTTPLTLGNNSTASDVLYGWLDDVRITKGTARYSGGTMTVPSAPFPNPGDVIPCPAPPPPPPPPGSPYRYWRLINVLTGGGFLEVSEIRLTAAGVDVLSGTMSSSDGTSAGPITNLYDNNLSTRAYWSEGTVETPGFYIAWDYGPGNEQAITGFKQGGFDTSTRYITDCTCQYSTDGLSWTTLGSAAGLTYPGNNTLSSNILFA